MKKWGGVLIILLYAIVYVSNYGSVYHDWDEFSHWGIFAKEMFRTNALFCTSPATMAHKDYVPAISIFETLWCQLSLKYSEANAYRGIQMLQGSMFLPLLTISRNGKEVSIKTIICRAIIVFGIPLYFGSFYHTIYQDLIYGVLVYYCLYVVIAYSKSGYKAFLITLSLTVLVLSKMTAMAFLPMIVIFYVVWTKMYESSGEGSCWKHVWGGGALATFVPVLSWMIFNKYVDCYVPNTGRGQSFDGISLDSFINIITRNGEISYQTDVDITYIKALFATGVVRRLPYVFAVLLAVGIVFWAARHISDDYDKKKMGLISLWIALASLAYALMMWYLYLTAFSEYEAKALASYSRYMQTMILADVYISCLTLSYYAHGIHPYFTRLVTFIVIQNIILFIDASQLLPGALLGEYMEYESEAEAVTSHSEDDASVLLVTCGSNGDAATKMMYLCAPRAVNWISPGDKRYDDDVWSKDITVDEFREKVSNYDMVYLLEIDRIFNEEYLDAFANPEVISDHRLYYVKTKDGLLVLEDVEE